MSTAANTATAPHAGPDEHNAPQGASSTGPANARAGSGAAAAQGHGQSGAAPADGAVPGNAHRPASATRAGGDAGAAPGAARAPARGQRGQAPKAARWLLRVVSLVLCLLGWHWVSTEHVNLGVITFQNVPPPLEVLQAARDLVESPRLGQHLGASLARVFSGFAGAAVVGIALGLVIGRSRWAEDVLLPPLEMLRPIPAVAWIPLAILMFPSSEMSMIFITFTGALFPILLNTIHGVEHVDARLVASARSLGAGKLAIFKEVILPGAAPSVVTGLAIGMGTAWFCLVTAEMISGQFGIGYYTWASYTVQNYAEIVVGMLFIGVFGMGSSALIKRLGLFLTPWQKQEKKA